ncbi:hypothetical protein GGP54_002915 [Salinibacter ruber]|uniref:Uncharacterized protein n=1 Tax=Salinibacter ruber TaxID=146919 RepID=A0A9X2UP84_9BACT|nr:hypothetical protein [Salinibacter ruber]MCS4037728.1 hypothetical protein [Salinibacter ruber]
MLFQNIKSALPEYITHSSPKNGPYASNLLSMGAQDFQWSFKVRKGEATETAPVFIFVVSVGKAGRKNILLPLLGDIFPHRAPEIKKPQADCLRATRCCCPMQPPALGDTTGAGAVFAPAGICSRWYFPVLALLPGSHPSAPFRRRRCGTGAGSAGCSARNGSAVWQAPNSGKASRNQGVGPTGPQGPPGHRRRGVEWK